MPVVVHAILILWLILVPVACFSRFPRHYVIAFAYLLGLLFLPMVDEYGDAGQGERGGPFAAITLPGLALSKLKVISLAVLLGVILSDRKRLSQFRLSWIDVPMIVWCLCPLPSLLGSPPPEGKDPLTTIMAQCLATFLVWGVPYFMGRIYFNSLSRLRDLATVIVVSALLYVPFCIYEMRMSPTLHARIYGFSQHEFQQSIRLGGYRPMVFMQHGLALGLFLVTATLLGFVLWRCGAVKEMFGSRWPRLVKLFPYALLGLAITAVLSRSTGALVLGAVGLTVLIVGVWPRTVLPLFCLWLVSPLYVGLRTAGVWSGTDLAPTISQAVGKDRADSFVFRQHNEDLLIDKALEAPPFGWGGWGRNLVHNKDGKIASTVDGLWVIILGERGLPGLIALWLAMLLPIGRFILKKPVSTWMQSDTSAAMICALVVVLYMIDNLMNNMNNPIFMLMAGGLTCVPEPVAPPAPPKLAPAVTDKRVFRWSLSINRLRRARLLEPPQARN